MTDISAVIALVETTLSDVARQAAELAMGLQNVAPSNKGQSPNHSMQYLSEAADNYADYTEKCRNLFGATEADQKEKLQEYVITLVALDKALRDKYQMGDKFRFVRDKIEALQATVQESFKSLTPEERAHKDVVGQDETVVYVYLFNAHGVTLPTWLKLLTPTIFYEHSVNRPIYIEKVHVEGFVRRKQNKVQHGYISVVIKKDDVLKGEGVDNLKDSYDHPLIKVKEGALKFEKMLLFCHNDIDYVLNEEGQLIRKL